ncbi:hypothetical protein ABW19_dt0206456 [Dactylella cylindrospora]|nr:hypothetical protein ABW19_dt0206456 [Dactylella cylindrospora]
MSGFKVKRNGAYQDFDDGRVESIDDWHELLQEGDVLEFWGPISPQDRDRYSKLYMRRVSPTSPHMWDIVRKKHYDDDNKLATIPCEIRVTSKREILRYVGRPRRSKEEDFSSLIQEIDRRARAEDRKKRGSLCGLTKLCQNAARKTANALRRIFGGGTQPRPRIEIPPLTMQQPEFTLQDKEDSNTDPFSSRRHLWGQRENSGFSPRPESQENSIFRDDADINPFEPRPAGNHEGIPSLEPNRRPPLSLFSRTKVTPSMVSDIEKVLARITEAEQAESEDVPTLELLSPQRGDASPDTYGTSVARNLNEATPERSTLGELSSWKNVEEPLSETPYFRLDGASNNPQQPDATQEEGQEPGVDETPDEASGPGVARVPFKMPIWKPPAARKATPSPVDLQGSPVLAYKNRLADVRYEQYMKCVEALARPVDPYDPEKSLPVDNQLVWMISHGYGVYTLADFYDAADRKVQFPQCPKSREEVIELSIDRQEPQYMEPQPASGDVASILTLGEDIGPI